MTDIRTLDHGLVVKAIADDKQPNYGRNADGYGRKIPTRYRLTMTDGRTRRVYVIIMSNSGSAYVIVGGLPHYLTPDTESMIESIR